MLLLVFAIVFSSCSNSHDVSSEAPAERSGTAAVSELAESSIPSETSELEEGSTDLSTVEEESSEESSLSLPDYLQKHEYQIVDTDDQHFGELILVNKEHACVGNGTMLRSLMDNDDRH